jgi:hypothetical protein
MKSEYSCIIKEYFESFSSQNIENLRDLYSEDIILKDWNISVKGKENVIKANIDIFKNIPNLKVYVERIIGQNNSHCESPCAFACQIKIHIDENTSIDVCDVIDVDTETMTITSIVAYKK